ncbi:polymorphic toxin-type HINT domain-containing protein [Actinacidiphila glaucinigra]|uniref:polymorphic toxin-type HINT domain-containing protein n=1 Tax=Actinacidiphila glaucinigra TaxID=235986 RepID=UPI003F4BA6A8
MRQGSVPGGRRRRLRKEPRRRRPRQPREEPTQRPPPKRKTGNSAQKASQAKAAPKSSSHSGGGKGGGGKSGGGGGSGKSGGSSRSNGGASGGGGSGKAGEGDTCNSFVPGTKVLMADGSTKAIEKIKVGDKVVATDPESGETRIETVTAEIKGQGLKHLVKVTIDIDGKHGTKTAKVTATDGHPFWVTELDEWIKATDLKSGQWLRTSAGTYVQIASIERWTVKQSTVNNLTVSDLHTYYVLAMCWRVPRRYSFTTATRVASINHKGFLSRSPKG